MKPLLIFVYSSVAAVILGVFWDSSNCTMGARSYNWPHVTGRIISSVARSKLMKGRHGEYIVHWPDVRYGCVVGDRRFVSDRIMFTHRGFSKSETQCLVDAYPLLPSTSIREPPTRRCWNQASGGCLSQYLRSQCFWRR
jgi:hypothetical protein